MNLIRNSIKFSRQQAEIAIIVSNNHKDIPDDIDKQAYNISVVDTGCGISNQD